MRLMIKTFPAIGLLSLTMLLAGAASAFEMRFVPVGGPLGDVEIGDTVAFDVFLDTQAANGVNLISISTNFDTTIFMYRPDLSSSDDYYPLYAPGVPNAKGVDPATWLNPGFADASPSGWTRNPPIESVPPSQPPGFLFIEFVANNLVPTTATATNLYLSTITFEAIANGSNTFTNGFIRIENVFGLAGGVDIQDQVTVVGDSFVVNVPEPALAMLSLAALTSVGVIYQRRRNS